MGQILQLEDFARVEQISTGKSDTGAVKTIEKQGFDKGYHAGWEDAVAEAKSSDQKARADAAAALQQIDFTYFEARQHVMNSFKPLLDAVMSAVLPTAARHALIPLVQEELEKLASTMEAPIEVYCAPETASIVSGQIDKQSKTPIEVKPEETLTASQVQLRYGEGMASVDMDAAVARIQNAIESFFESSEFEAKLHG